MFRRFPSVKKQLWGGEFWTAGYYINTVGKRGNEDIVRQYVKKQGKQGDYIQLHSGATAIVLGFDTPQLAAG
jgi:putative transposase